MIKEKQKRPAPPSIDAVAGIDNNAFLVRAPDVGTASRRLAMEACLLLGVAVSYNPDGNDMRLDQVDPDDGRVYKTMLKVTGDEGKFYVSNVGMDSYFFQGLYDRLNRV